MRVWEQSAAVQVNHRAPTNSDTGVPVYAGQVLDLHMAGYGVYRNTDYYFPGDIPWLHLHSLGHGNDVSIGDAMIVVNSPNLRAQLEGDGFDLLAKSESFDIPEVDFQRLTEELGKRAAHMGIGKDFLPIAGSLEWLRHRKNRIRRLNSKCGDF